MSVVKRCRLVIVVFLLFIAVGSLPGQYIIEQVEYEVPVPYDLLPEDTDFEETQDEAKFFLNLPEEKLTSAARAQDELLAISKSTFYVKGDNFAVESETPEQGRVSMISDPGKGMFYYIIWPQKKVMEMSTGDLKEIQAQAKAAGEKMMENLSPEMRKQIEEAQEAGKARSRSTTAPQPTGKKMMKYGFACEQYWLEKDEEMSVIWASDDKVGVTQKVQQISEKFKAAFPDEEGDNGKDEWDLLPGKIPVEIRTFRGGFMGEPAITIQAITRIEETTPPADKFVVPGEGEGFERSSFKEMMEKMMQMMPGEEQE